MLKDLKFLTVALMSVLLFSSGQLFAYGKQIEKAKDPALFGGLESEAGKAIQKFHTAIRNGDTETLQMLLDPQVLIFEGGKAERSFGEYASHHMQADIEFMRQMQVEDLELQVRQQGKHAWSAGRTRMTGEYKDKQLDLMAMESLVLSKINGQWKVVFVHWSN